MRKFTILFAVLALTAAGLGLDGQNGYTATELFQWGDVRASVVYPAGFLGVKWADMDLSVLGGPGVNSGGLAANSAGDLFFLAHGWIGGNEYTGLIHFDGSTFVHLAQALWDNSAASLRIERVVVSPVTAGRLTADHPVIVRSGPGDGIPGPEIVSIDPTTSPPTETSVWVGLGAQSFDLDGNGTIFRLSAPDILTSTYDAGAGAYVDGTVPTAFAAGRSLRVGPDGAVYTFPLGVADGQKNKVPIHRIDPSTGVSSLFAQVQNKAFIRDWAWDSNGKLWIALWDVKRNKRLVTEVIAGQTTSNGNAVAEGGSNPDDLAAGPDGTLFVRQLGAAGNGSQDTITKLTPPGGEPPPPPPPPSAIAADDFESGGFGGGTGAWNGAWTKSGDVRMRTNRNGPHSGASHVRLRRSTGYLERSVDLLGRSGVKLRFWAKVNSFESGDQALVKVSPDGVNYTTVHTFTSADSNNTYHFYEIDLSGFQMTADFRIAFDAQMGDKKDRLYLDDVELVD